MGCQHHLAAPSGSPSGQERKGMRWTPSPARRSRWSPCSPCWPGRWPGRAAGRRRSRRSRPRSSWSRPAPSRPIGPPPRPGGSAGHRVPGRDPGAGAPVRRRRLVPGLRRV